MTTKLKVMTCLLAGVIASVGVATPAEAATTAQGWKAVRFASAQRGEPYVFGAAGPNRWDCSGLTQKAWKAAGKWIPRTTWGQIKVGKRVSRRYLRAGDLVFTSPGHVQLYAGSGYVIAAEGSRVVKRKMWGFYTARRP